MEEVSHQVLENKKNVLHSMCIEGDMLEQALHLRPYNVSILTCKSNVILFDDRGGVVIAQHNWNIFCNRILRYLSRENKLASIVGRVSLELDDSDYHVYVALTPLGIRFHDACHRNLIIESALIPLFLEKAIEVQPIPHHHLHTALHDHFGFVRQVE